MLQQPPEKHDRADSACAVVDAGVPVSPPVSTSPTMGKKAKPPSGTGAALSEDAQEFASRAEALRQSGDALFAQGKCVYLVRQWDWQRVGGLIPRHTSTPACAWVLLLGV